MTEKQVERAIEHLLALHARAEARMDRMDKQIQATANLVRAGIRIVIRLGQENRQLARETRQTNQRLDKLIGALYRTERNGRNGR
jgi:hypothetical protein